MEIHNNCRTLSFQKGVFIENQDIKKLSFMYLITGKITVSIIHPNGKHIPFRHIKAGEYFGLSLLNEFNENLSFLTTSPVKISLIDENHFFNLISTDKKCLKKYLLLHSSRISFLIEKMILFSIQNNRQRIIYYFIAEIKRQKKSTVKINMSKSNLMEYLGMSRGSFYREFNYLIEEDIIMPITKNTYNYNMKKLKELLIDN